MKKIISTLFAVFFLMGLFNSANAATTFKCQTVLNAKGDEVKMLRFY